MDGISISNSPFQIHQLDPKEIAWLIYNYAASTTFLFPFVSSNHSLSYLTQLPLPHTVSFWEVTFSFWSLCESEFIHTHLLFLEVISITPGQIRIPC